ncbi:MarR family winged helix-turn-helix transcriptional regulator [Arthrobacter sp. NPDC093125]|uniref:MarR family winged helix-turn-helix transcriptional regulator n=1 Tax=Arthrobacter sp. NPDC093125 TaxID=3363944 RepID=UPI00381EFF3F
MVPNADAEQWGPHQLLSMAARLIQRRQDQALADLGLTHAAVIALQGLTSGPLNQEQLAEEIHVRSQSLGRVLARLEEAGFVARKSSSLDRRSNDVSITEAGLRALAAARQVEKETLPPDVVEGTVLSRELARVISYFPGSPRLGSRPRKKLPEEADTQGTETQGADAQGADAQGADVEGSDIQQVEPRRPEPGEPAVPNESGTPAEPPSERIDGAPGEAAAETARRLNGTREN